MIIDLNYWNKILKKVLYYVVILIFAYIGLKLAFFFLPFLIAWLIANCIEPFIKFINKKTKLLRNTSAKIALIIVFSIIIGVITGSSILIVTEVVDLLKNFADLGNSINSTLENLSDILKLENVNISDELRSLIVNTTNGLISHALDYLKNFLTEILNLITQIPTFFIYLVITILATYFICVDRISILDNLEQIFPKRLIKKVGGHFSEITKKLGKYLKAELILVSVSFVLVLIGLYIFKFVGLNVESPFLISLGIGFVDLLPILGSSAAMIPWAIVSMISGDITLGIAILVLLVIISAVRQFLEPRIVSNQLGIHPLYTLISMYIGFKISGVIGLIIGPIIFIILQNFIMKEHLD